MESILIKIGNSELEIYEKDKSGKITICLENCDNYGDCDIATIDIDSEDALKLIEFLQKQINKNENNNQ